MPQFVSLNLPSYSFNIKDVDGTDFLFDSFRKKFVKLTPEEWVRQNFARFLIEERGFPAGRIVVEKSLIYNKLSKRCDLLIYDEEGKPLVMVECKAPGVKIIKETFDQIAVYNLEFKVRYLLVTNGLSHYAAEIDFDNRKVSFMEEIPHYQNYF